MPNDFIRFTCDDIHTVLSQRDVRSASLKAETEHRDDIRERPKDARFLTCLPNARYRM